MTDENVVPLKREIVSLERITGIDIEFIIGAEGGWAGVKFRWHHETEWRTGGKKVLRQMGRMFLLHGGGMTEDEWFASVEPDE